ncbi:MAG: hypothetical protein PHD67_05460 [Oscillospiraceae bacterium]|nr:hypothetical protein [Oscillospiraceae bacterium]
MKILTEANLRAALLPKGTASYTVTPDTFVTPLAREFLRERGIELVFSAPSSPGVMTRTPLPDQGGRTYVDAVTGEGYREKPEGMTHLRGNLLVPKTHPRILFRGRLDSLEADILKVQVLALEKGIPALCGDLQEVLDYVRQILAAEVKEQPLADIPLFGLSQAQLRQVSHHVKEHFGIDHPIPDCSMGEPAVSLNLLRARAREVELCAAAAFSAPGQGREDLIQHLNRLSSGVYILFCRVISGWYQKGGSSR